MIKRIQKEIFDIIGISLLLLSSFYFFKFSLFAVPDYKFILLELLKIILLLILINIFFEFTQKNKFKNFFLFIFLVYISIFFLKLLFNISGNISLHYFLKIIYSSIFNFRIDDKIPLYVKVLSYCTPFILIISVLFFLKNSLIKVKKFFIIFGFFVSIIVLWDLIKIFDKQNIIFKKDYKDTSYIIDPNKKVLWLLFDGLDPEYIDLRIGNTKGKKLFPNYNNLKEKSVFHNNMYPPSNWTLYSMPSQLMGLNIKEMIPKHNTLIFKTLDDKFVPFNFENSIFGKINNLGYDVSLLSSVLEYCTAYLISSNWKYCEDYNSQNKPNSILKESIRFYFSLIYKVKIYLHELKLIKSPSKFSLLNSNVDENIPISKIEDIDLDNLYIDNNFSADHIELININKIIENLKKTNLMYTHIYNPHLLSNSENHIKNKLKINFEGVDPYILKYLYTDLFIKKLLNELKQNQIEDLLLIISSDHWNRDKRISDNQRNSNGDYIGNSFFLAKILNDNNSYILEEASNSIIIPSIIENYFLKKINSNNDIYDFINSNQVVVHTLIKK